MEYDLEDEYAPTIVHHIIFNVLIFTEVNVCFHIGSTLEKNNTYSGDKYLTHTAKKKHCYGP
jgi:hypothetical protein